MYPLGGLLDWWRAASEGQACEQPSTVSRSHLFAVLGVLSVSLVLLNNFGLFGDGSEFVAWVDSLTPVEGDAAAVPAMPELAAPVIDAVPEPSAVAAPEPLEAAATQAVGEPAL